MIKGAGESVIKQSQIMDVELTKSTSMVRSRISGRGGGGHSELTLRLVSLNTNVQYFYVYHSVPWGTTVYHRV